MLLDPNRHGPRQRSGSAPNLSLHVGTVSSMTQPAEDLPARLPFYGVSLDIETSGLDPSVNEVLAVGLSAQTWSLALTGKEEPTLLRILESTIRTFEEGSVILTWNGEEFDLPFLRRRYELLGLDTALELTPKQGVGKYGGAVFEARWGKSNHIDIAPFYREIAERLGVPWSLKPVAIAELDVEPVEVDRRGDRIAQLSDEELRSYVSSDAAITYQLSVRALSEVRSGQS